MIEPHPEPRASAARAATPDLNRFFDRDRDPAARQAPERTRALAASLHRALSEVGADGRPAAHATLAERIVTDAFLRSEADRDQNVYLGAFFTRRLTRAVPDLIFQPLSPDETARALAWARAQGVAVTLRGAASTAMGGSVPNQGGLVLDLSRLDAVEIDASERVCAVGAGARLRTVHQRLAERGLALKAYPSNLGGTLAGWFVTGGVGMNAFGRGRALDGVRAADVLLPGGEHLRFHDDGRLDVPDHGGRHRALSAAEAAEWFRARGAEPLTLADWAGSEGVLGVLLQLIVAVEPRPAIAAFLLAFATEAEALAAAEWTRRQAGARFGPPANLKFLSGSHLHHLRRVWADEDAREWRRRPGALAAGDDLPWTEIAGPAALGAGVGAERGHSGACLFVDFFDRAAAAAFAAALGECPGSPVALGEESARFAAERFKPQQTKRLGPGLLAAEILMPAAEVPRFLDRARRLTARAGNRLDAEVYYLADGEALVIGGVLTDHRRGSFLVDLMIPPALLDLAIAAHHGRPYVLGRWQAAFFDAACGRERAQRLRGLKAALDPRALLNPGVLVELKLEGALGRLLARRFRLLARIGRLVYATPGLSLLARAARLVLGGAPGPARGAGAPLAATAPPVEDRALHCVNCGECNSVCPIFHQSKIRLPQMLTHLGEAMRAGRPIPETGDVLLDLCMRCGNCEQVCQAGIPHLPLYQRMQEAADRARPPDRERHAAIVAAVRGSSGYLNDFLRVRPGGYLKRSPASLPGLVRYLVLRSENDAGPAATCIHCGACVSVCPTQANREYEGADPRWIVTDQGRCIGCGTCVEICPANLANGGQTLRVMEAPTRDWFVALDEFERGGWR